MDVKIITLPRGICHDLANTEAYRLAVSWSNEIRKLPQVWALRSGSCYKLGSVESEGVMKEKEVAMLSVYNQSYLALSVGEEVMVTKKNYY